MTNNIQKFNNEEFGTIEVLLIDGKPYFPATVCAKTLGYKDPFDAIKRHTKGSVKRRVLTSGGEQERKYIPEGDLYRLIIRSKLPGAERFERWVFDEVLPTIREHGAYVTDGTMEKIMQDPEFGIRLLQALKTEKDKNAALQKRTAELTPKARYYDKILQSTNALQVSLIAKDYGMSAVTFNKLLHELGIQYKMGGTWVLYQKYAGKGYTKSRTYHASEYTSVLHTCWSQRGRLFLYTLLKQNGIIPLIESDDAAANFMGVGT